MMKVFSCVAVFLFMSLDSLCVQAYCSEIPAVQVVFQNSEPEYYSVPSEKVIELCKKSAVDAIGCTHPWLTYSYEYTPSTVKKCFKIAQVRMNLYFKELYVYIDDKYPIDSCEYNSIKKHEDRHVKIAQSVDVANIKQTLEDCLRKANQKNMNKVMMGKIVNMCVKQAFDLDNHMRGVKDREWHLDKTQYGSIHTDCPHK